MILTAVKIDGKDSGERVHDRIPERERLENWEIFPESRYGGSCICDEVACVSKVHEIIEEGQRSTVPWERT